MPLIIVGSAIFFNCMNAGLNGYFLAHFESYGPDSFYQWNFILGIVLFIVGFIINQNSDHILGFYESMVHNVDEVKSDSKY